MATCYCLVGFIISVWIIVHQVQGEGRCADSLDVVLLIDNSGSITEVNPNNWDILKNFVKSIIQSLNPTPDGDRFAAVTFSATVTTAWFFNTYTDVSSYLDAVDNLYYEGAYTNIAGALQRARDELLVGQRGDRYNVPNLVILITDGKDNNAEDSTLPNAKLLREISTIVAVGVTDDIDIDQLRQIATNPDDVITVQDFDALVDILEELLDLSCNVATPEDDCQINKYLIAAVSALGAFALLLFIVVCNDYCCSKKKKGGGGRGRETDINITVEQSGTATRRKY